MFCHFVELVVGAPFDPVLAKTRAARFPFLLSYLANEEDAASPTLHTSVVCESLNTFFESRYPRPIEVRSLESGISSYRFSSASDASSAVEAVRSGISYLPPLAGLNMVQCDEKAMKMHIVVGSSWRPFSLDEWNEFFADATRLSPVRRVSERRVAALASSPVFHVCGARYSIPFRSSEERLAGFGFPGKLSDFFPRFSVTGARDESSYWRRETRVPKELLRFIALERALHEDDSRVVLGELELPDVSALRDRARAPPPRLWVFIGASPSGSQSHRLQQILLDAGENAFVGSDIEMDIRSKLSDSYRAHDHLVVMLAPEKAWQAKYFEDLIVAFIRTNGGAWFADGRMDGGRSNAIEFQIFFQ